MSQTDLGSLALSCRGNVMEQTFGVCFDVPWECGSPPWEQGLRSHCHWKMTSKQALSSHVWLSVCWQNYLPWKKERHPQRFCFQASICSKCFTSQMSDLQTWTESLNSRVRAICLPALSETCKHIPRLEQYCPGGIWLRECIWGYWVPYWGHLFEGTLQLWWAPAEELWASPLLQKSQSGEPS